MVVFTLIKPLLKTFLVYLTSSIMSFRAEVSEVRNHVFGF